MTSHEFAILQSTSLLEFYPEDTLYKYKKQKWKHMQEIHHCGIIHLNPVLET